MPEATRLGIANGVAGMSLGYRDDIEKKPSSIEMVSVQASAGLVAGALSSVITTPIDTVKTRLQSWTTMVMEDLQ
ncbi:Mitoferrin [Bienertia sinuspersici]